MKRIIFLHIDKYIEVGKISMIITLDAMLLDNQSRPSYSPCPDVAQVLWIYLFNTTQNNTRIMSNGENLVFQI